jgi:hypothetical protein
MRLELPLHILIPRKTKEDKKVFMNLNTYRNLHHMTNNQAKVIFKDIVKNAMPADAKPFDGKVGLFYTVFPASNRALDISNVCSVVDKFACDALTELGMIPDDNHKIIPSVMYQFGSVDKVNPRCELEIVRL